MKPKLLIAIAGIIIIAVLGSWTYSNNPQSDKVSVKKQAQPLPEEVQVTLSAQGFSPQETKIKVGTAVRWKNISGEKQTVNSDDYPTNQLHKELNFGIFEDGSSVVYIFKKSGKFGYHNQFKPDQKGVIIVSE